MALPIDDSDGKRARRSAADTFCKHCGLCCDGTFFGSVVIDQGERESLGRVGLRVVDSNGALSMPQSCSALRGCLCSVYADRPKACREYECTLRERLLDGSTSDEAARGSLARVRVLLTATRGAFNLPTTSIWEAILSLDDPEPTDPLSEAGRRFDAGVEAISELLELTRTVFEPEVGGDRSSTARTRDD